jgi:hypothetical protein
MFQTVREFTEDEKPGLEMEIKNTERKLQRQKDQLKDKQELTNEICKAYGFVIVPYPSVVSEINDVVGEVGSYIASLGKKL